MNLNFIKTGLSLLLLLVISSCTVYQGGSQGSGNNSDNLTVGKVQKEIKKGMSGADVAEALGSPNIVSKDDNGMETWIYDKIATEVNYSETSSGWFLILAGGSSKAANASVSQKTLTVVIKFNDDKRVEYISYHASKF